MHGKVLNVFSKIFHKLKEQESMNFFEEKDIHSQLFRNLFMMITEKERHWEESSVIREKFVKERLNVETGKKIKRRGRIDLVLENKHCSIGFEIFYGKESSKFEFMQEGYKYIVPARKVSVNKVIEHTLKDASKLLGNDNLDFGYIIIYVKGYVKNKHEYEVFKNTKRKELFQRIRELGIFTQNKLRIEYFEVFHDFELKLIGGEQKSCGYNAQIKEMQ